MGQGEHGGLYDGFFGGAATDRRLPSPLRQRRGDHPPEPSELILLTKALDNYVITIGRRFGSLGRAVAREAADLPSIQYYGRDIEEEIAKRVKQPVKEISEVEKDAESRFDVFGNILAQVLALSPLHKGALECPPDLAERLRRRSSLEMVTTSLCQQGAGHRLRGAAINDWLSQSTALSTNLGGQGCAVHEMAGSELKSRCAS